MYFIQRVLRYRTICDVNAYETWRQCFQRKSSVDAQIVMQIFILTSDLLVNVNFECIGYCVSVNVCSYTHPVN